MVDEKFMLVSLSDPKMKGIAEVLGNKTCKKIIDYLAENEEASQKDLSDSLNLPINTVEYNIKKLVESGLIQKRKNFFWSKKGKKIIMYELSNKSIVISPRKSVSDKFKSLIPAFMLISVGTFAVWVYEKLSFEKSKEIVMNGLQKSSSVVTDFSSSSGAEVLRVSGEHVNEIFNVSLNPLWLTFLSGALIALFVVSLVNWRKL